jgi:predicted phosphodiesterase
MNDLCIAVLSDIHGNRWALEAVLRDIRMRRVRSILNLGDSLYGPLDPAGTARMLRGLDIVSVRGNEDRILIEPVRGAEVPATIVYGRRALSEDARRWLESLKMTAVAFDDLFLCHGTPERDADYLIEEVTAGGVRLRNAEDCAARLSGIEQPVVLCGHSHVPRTMRVSPGKLVVNPGAVGLPAFRDDAPHPHAMETGSPHARYAVMARESAGWTVEHVVVGYDWEAAAAIAREHGRADWAEWLRTGRARG